MILVVFVSAFSLVRCIQSRSNITTAPMAVQQQQIATHETAALQETSTAEPKYNYISFRRNNQWVTTKLKHYEIVDGGQNIKFEIDTDVIYDKVYYTSMANVELIARY